MENLPVQTAGFAAWTEQIVASLHAERDGVRKFLTAQQTRLERAEATLEEAIAQLEAAVSNGAAEAANKADDGGEEEYRRRYEMALDDLRELKASNSSLQEQLSKARVAASTFAKEDRAHQPSLNWETEKLRILAALESELDENNSEQRAERLKIEEVLQSTERAIAEKDKEIQELKQRLEKSASAEPLDQMAAAIEQTLQNDIVIQQERERLRQLDEQLQSRLCRAEIENLAGAGEVGPRSRRNRGAIAGGRARRRENAGGLERGHRRATAARALAEPAGVDRSRPRTRKAALKADPQPQWWSRHSCLPGKMHRNRQTGMSAPPHFGQQASTAAGSLAPR